LITQNAATPVANSLPLLENPDKLTIQQLRSRLTALDVPLPPAAQLKPVYLDLLYKNDPSLKDRQPPAAENKKKK
jgi:hypothetical protein